MSGIEFKNGCIVYYGNPAGYLKEDKATVDKMFQSKEFEDWLADRNLEALWKDGVFERLSKGEQLTENSEVRVPMKNVRIWQLKPDSDFELRFRSYDEIQNICGEPSIKNYDAVYDGELDTNDLEAIYSKFNIDHPEGFTGHSLSISDVVEIYDDSGRGFHYVDRIGFKEIEFGSNEQEHGITMSL
jgi:hypothetical protein